MRSYAVYGRMGNISFGPLPSAFPPPEWRLLISENTQTIMDPNPNPTDDDDQWFPQDWDHTSFPALPLSNTHGFDIDFRWGSTWLDEQGTPGVVAEHASPDVPMTNWQSLQEVRLLR